MQWTWPTGEGPFPIVMMVTSEKGKNAFFEREIQKWIERSYAVVSIDLFNGVIPQDDREANRLKDQLSLESTEKLLNMALEQKSKDRRGDSTRIGVLAWGVGATHALRWLRGQESVRAAALISPTPLRQKAELSKIRRKVLIAYPSGEDAGIKRDRADFQKLMTEAKVDFEWKEYSAKSALFMDFTDQKNFSLHAAEELKTQVNHFFDRYVGLRAYK